MRRLLGVLFLLFIILWIFHSAFFGGIIAGGDLWYLFPSMYGNFPLHTFSWNWNLANAFGGFAFPSYWVYLDYGVPVFIFGKLLGLSWDWIVRLSYIYPFLLTAIISSAFLYKKLFPKSVFFVISSLIFTTNTYVLMLYGGGQYIILLAYALIPFIFWTSGQIERSLHCE